MLGDTRYLLHCLAVGYHRFPER